MKLILIGVFFTVSVFADENIKRWPPLPDSCLPNGDRDQCITRICEILPLNTCSNFKNVQEIAKLCKVPLLENCLSQ